MIRLRFCALLLILSALPLAADCSVIQNAINACAVTGCEIDLSATTYACGMSGITVPSGLSGLVMKGISQSATVLTYTGAGAFLSVGDTIRQITYFTLKDVQLNIAGADPAAIGVLCTQCWWSRIQDVTVQSTNGSPTPNSQIGIQFYGGSGSEFGAYNRIENPVINGDFGTGILFNGNIGPAMNSNQILGGSVVMNAQSKGSSIGINLDAGDGNFVFGTNLENFNTGIRVNNHENFVSVRYEANNTDWVATSVATGNTFWGIGVSTFDNQGIDTSYMSTSNGGLNEARLVMLRVAGEGSQPSCVPAKSGALWFTDTTPGHLYLCAQNSSGVYAWGTVY